VGAAIKSLEGAVREKAQTPASGGTRVGGLSIYFPWPTQVGAGNLATYDELSFARHSGWGQFLSSWLTVLAADGGGRAPKSAKKRTFAARWTATT
jgi:hypothetical protein